MVKWLIKLLGGMTLEEFSLVQNAHAEERKVWLATFEKRIDLLRVDFTSTLNNIFTEPEPTPEKPMPAPISSRGLSWPRMQKKLEAEDRARLLLLKSQINEDEKWPA